MKLLFSSDLHGRQDAYERYTAELKAGPYDLGILGGDLLDEWLPDELAVTLTQEAPDSLLDELGGEDDDPVDVWKNSLAKTALDRALLLRVGQLVSLLATADKPVYFVLGNHDRTPWPESDLLKNLHGTQLRFQDRQFVGYRWTNMDREPNQLEADIAELRPLVDSDTILVTHAPPRGILDGSREWGEGFGLPALRGFRPKPWLHLVGHVHSAAGRRGRYVNGAWPTVRQFFSIDVDRRRVQKVGRP
jgi:Icc-related predicted phosphoesterase